MPVLTLISVSPSLSLVSTLLIQERNTSQLSTASFATLTLLGILNLYMMAIQTLMMKVAIQTQIGLETLETITQSQVLSSSCLVPLSFGAQRSNCQFPSLIP